MLAESAPLAEGLIGAGSELHWPAANRPGDILHVLTTVTAIVPSRTRAERGIVTIQGETRNQRGDVVQRTLGRLVVFRRPSP